MAYCRTCYAVVEETAAKCPSCGAIVDGGGWTPPPSSKPRRRPISGVIAVLCLLSGFVGAIVATLWVGHGGGVFVATMLGIFSIGVGAGLAAIAAIVAMIRSERWAVVPAMVLLISIFLALWVVGVFMWAPPQPTAPLNEQLRRPGN